MNLKERLARLSIEAINEEMLAAIYAKLIQQYNGTLKKADRIPETLNFYISVFYNDVLLKSRTLNAQKEQHTIHKIEEKHLLFFDSNGKTPSGAPVARTTKKASTKYYSLLRIGYLSIIVSDDNKFAVELCSGIIAAMYVNAKSTAVIKEVGQLHDLVKFCKEKDEGVMSEYLKQVTGIQSGFYGGHS